MPGPAESDRAIPNLPSRDFDATAAFYAGFGFDCTFRDEGWMILTRGGLQLEFFPYPGLDPTTSNARLRDGRVHRDPAAARVLGTHMGKS